VSAGAAGSRYKDPQMILIHSAQQIESLLVDGGA
jgi:hypothetical protein